MSAEFIKACKTMKLSPAQKSVLMTMAWYASDAGEFWYSIATICEWTCLCDRAVRRALQDLVQLGLLTPEKRVGSITRYSITPAGYAGVSVSKAASDFPQTPAPDADPEAQETATASTDTPAPNAGDPGTSCTPAPDSPRHQMPDSPAPNAGVPRHEIPGTPAPNADDKQIQLLTTNKTNRARADAQRTYSVTDLVALGINQQHAADFLKTRKEKGAKALTQSALDRIQREADKAGITLAEAIQEAAERSWRGFEAAWLKNTSTGRGPSRHSGFDQRDYTAGIGPDGKF